MSSEESTSKTRRTKKELEEEMLSQMQQNAAQAVTEEQKKFLDALNNLILNVQELSYAVALVPEDMLGKSDELKDLMASARNVIRSAYEFHKLVKQGTSKQ